MNEKCFYRISVKGIVIDTNGRVLLTREDNNKWEMLGGGLEHSEDPIDCLKREILEEAGIKVTSVSAQPKFFLTAKNLTHDFYVANLVYEIELENLDFTPSDECQELRFFSVEEMKRLDTYPNIKGLVRVIEEDQTL